MNNKGQTLVLFITLLPFIFILLVLVFDISFLSSEKTKLDNIATSSLKSAMIYRDINQIKANITKNDKDIKIDKLTQNRICLSKKTNPIFGKVIGYNSYNLKSCLKGTISNGKIIIDKEGK